MSKQDEEQIVKFLYKAGIHINMEMKLKGLEELQQAVQKLEMTEAEIITRKYLARESDYTSHQAIYKDLGMSPGSYKKHRLRALTKLAGEMEIRKF